MALRPTMQFQQLNRAYQTDPRRVLGQALMQQGASSAPVQSPLQGLGRLSSALVGAYLQRKASDQLAERENTFRNNLTQALSGMDLSAVPSLQALAQVSPEQALPAALGLETNLAVARAKRTPTQTETTLTTQQAVAEGLPTDRGQIYQKNDVTGAIDLISGTAGPQLGNRERDFAFMREYATKAPGERSQDDVLQYAQLYGFYSKPQVITTTDPNGNQQQIRTTPLNLSALGLPQPITLTGEPITNFVADEVIGTKKPTVDSSTAVRVAQADFALDELANVQNTLFPEGKYNRSVVYGATGPGSVLSSDGRLLRQQINRVVRDLIYLESGAQVGVEEAAAAAGLYFPSPLDDEKSARAKIDALIRKFSFFKKAATQGKGLGASENDTQNNQGNVDGNNTNQPKTLKLPGT